MPAHFNAILPQPPVTLGYYRDIAVLAFQVPPAETNGVAAAAPGTGKLVITRATYEAESGGGSADVTAKITELIKSGQASVGVNNDELGGDPAAGETKRLTVEFTFDGKPGTLTASEGDIFIFPVTAGQMAVARHATKSAVDHTFVRPPASGSASIGAPFRSTALWI